MGFPSQHVIGRNSLQINDLEALRLLGFNPHRHNSR